MLKHMGKKYMKAEQLFDKKCIIGMVHCLPLPGTLNYGVDVELIYERAVADAIALEKGGATALIVENQHDIPTPLKLSPEQFASLAVAAGRVREAVSLPIGIDAAFCDWEASIAIAYAVQADFIRLPVYVDDVMVAAGNVHPCCMQAIRYRNQLHAENILFLCDIQVKHSYMTVPGMTPINSAKMAEENGADAIIVTGSTTGEATPMDLIKSVREIVKVPLLVGSGFSAKNAAEQLPYIDGAIVGSSLKEDGVITRPVDIGRVAELMSIVNKFNK